MFRVHVSCIIAAIILIFPGNHGQDQAGVYLSLKGKVYPNNSLILITEIGITDTKTPLNSNNGLQCITNKMPCCSSPNRAGEWYFPDNGGIVPILMNATTFFRNRGGNGTVNLNRLNDSVTLPVGRYCCVVPDDTDVMIWACANISTRFMVINGGDIPTLGQNYSLNCTDIGATSTTYQWRRNGDKISNETGSTLSFSSLMLSNVGLYSCGNGTLFSNNKSITLQITVVSDLRSPVVVGSNVSLTCTVELSPSVDVSVTVNTVWTGPAGFMATNTAQPVMGSTTTYTSTVMLNSFETSQSGQYNCTANISSTSSFLTDSSPQCGTSKITAIKFVITTSGTNIAGANYSLVCSATVTESSILPAISWLDPMNNTVTDHEMVTATDGTSTLTFNQLSVSYAGTYTCTAVVDDEVRAMTIMLNVLDPIINVRVDIDVVTTMSGSTYSLNCTVTGAEMLTGSTTYQWFKNDDMVVGQKVKTYSITPLSFTDAGGYTCQAIIMSNLLSGPITMISSNSINITLTLPTPTGNITSSPTGIITAGSSVNLTCTVELSPSVDVPVTVNTVWTGPPEVTLSSPNSFNVSSTRYISKTMVNTFRRDQSGNYTCTTTLSSTSAFIINSTALSVTTRVTVGVYLSLKEVVYPNNSMILITEIGTTDMNFNNRLQCVTDRMPCCRLSNARAGEWHFPNGTVVSNQGTATSFYRNRADNGTVNLNRIDNDVKMPTGLFCCVVPDATGVMQRTCAVIFDIIVSITTSGNSTAGARYSLVCSVTVTRSTDQPIIITWLGPMNSQVTSEIAMVSTTGSMSTLTFDPLSASHNGIYTCRAMVAGGMRTDSEMVIVQNPLITVKVDDQSNTAAPMAGSSYSLNCTVTGAERLNGSTITYQWFKDGEMVSGQAMKSYSFARLSFSDAGGYTCRVTLMSDLLSGSFTTTSLNPISVTLKFPPPSIVTVTPPGRNVIAGSSININCTVRIRSTANINVPANVSATWTVPDNVIVGPTLTTPFVENQQNYTLSANFDRIRSGNYTCYANIYSTSQFINSSGNTSGTTSINVVPLPPPTDLMIVNTTATSITLNWAQPEGADAVDRYEISYSFVVTECVRDGVTTTVTDLPVTLIVNNGSQRLYNITNSSDTPVEEDSQYIISLRANNSIATSEEVTINMTTTQTAAPTGPPKNISIISVSATGATIQWDEVDCRKRNGEILGYQVQLSGNMKITNTTETSFKASGLLPRNKYKFNVSALNAVSCGPPGNITVTTAVPPQVGLLLGENTYGNNSIVSFSEIGEESEALHCLTNKDDCCRGVDSEGAAMGEWYFPNNESALQTKTLSEGGSIYRNRGPSVVRLNRRNNAMMPNGVYCCEIPDANGTNQRVYVGVYSLGKGAPTINEPLEYRCDIDEQVIICTSIGGPATNVQWWKNDKLLPVQSDQQQRIVSTSDSVYQNVLVLGQRDADEVVGNYTCGVSNIRGEANGTIHLHGIQTSVVINEDDGSMSINCTTDLAVTTIEWLDHNHRVLVNTSTEPYLEFSVVQGDANTEFVCRVTSPFGRQNKSLTLSLPTELSRSSAVYGASVAAVMVLLMVTVVVVLVVLVAFKRSKKRQMRLYHVSVDISPQHKQSHSPPYESNDSLAVSLTHVSTEVDAECIELKECSEIVEGKEENTYAEDVTAVASEDITAVPVSEFHSHVVSFHANRDKLFEKEYTSISKNPQSPHIVGELPYNKNKNRFGNIFPYDTSRVKLKEIPGEEGSDYINASYVNGYNKRKAYIAAQGPMPNTVTDFWRMIWEKKLPTIVMLTRCFEGRKKCEEYWPVNVGECVEPGHGLSVTLTSLLPFAEYSVRKMTVTWPTVPNSVPLRLVHFHFTGWPDHGVPQNGVVLINFIKRVRSAHPYTDTRPLLVHCSAGVGRTGAFIVLDSMLQRMKVEENFNIFEFVIQLRARRVLMVQTQSQYNFIHDALNEVTLCGDTEISASDLRVVVSRLSQASDGETGYSNQFNLLNQMSPATSEADYTQANMECNVNKNRYINVLPNDHYRVMLRATTVPGSDYINASFVDGYKQRGAYIASQTPLENTISDFWKMILEYRSRTIVVVNEEVSHTYIPEHIGECEVYGKVLVKVVSQQNSTDYIIRQLEIFEDKPHPQGFVPSPHPVTMFHFMCWPQYGIPQVTSTFLQLIEDVNRAQMSSGNKPITVMCNDGVGRTGTFICIHAQLERLKTEGVVDFFQSIKSARIQRVGLVSDIQQYIFCHSVVADYLDGFDTYANFKELV